MTLWEGCDGPGHIVPLAGTLYRLVESQEQIATLSYVDTLEEQALLEQLLEQAKPRYPASASGYHYLLQTPFRYPPLRWGSRFGQTHEPGILYGGCSITTTLAESAYYRLIFWHSMPPHPSKHSIDTAHTLFSVGYRSMQGIALHKPPFADHHAILTHPCDYTRTQHLGTAMRGAGVDLFEYVSARDVGANLCVGLFTPTALSRKTPASTHQWLCETRSDQVTFKALSQRTVYKFPDTQFIVDGRLPVPA